MTEDLTLTCKECKNEFIWIGKEQDFFTLKGFQPPKRCKECIKTGFKESDGLTSEERQAKYEREHQTI